MQYSTS